MGKALQYFLLPSGLVVLLFCVGIAVVAFRKMRKWGAVLLFAAAAIYGAFGAGPVAYGLLGSLEYRHPALDPAEPVRGSDAVVVLAGWGEFNPDVPLTGQVNVASAYRVLEAVRLARELPEAEIVIAGEGDVPRLMKSLVVSLGIPAARVAVDDGGRSTRESALRLRDRLAGKRFLLVTSAGHMSRALGVFRKLGMEPVPAPTHYLTKRNVLATAYLPSPEHLRQSDLAVHEYAGLMWYKLRGWI